ncbi:reverse transcriptase [Trichonephila clavipes]|nr:reverse transcriptase [Trichonephila clavipes]
MQQQVLLLHKAKSHTTHDMRNLDSWSSVILPHFLLLLRLRFLGFFYYQRFRFLLLFPHSLANILSWPKRPRALESHGKLAIVGPIPRPLDRAEAVARFRLTTGHDFLGVYLHWLGLAADEACTLCGYARMNGDRLLQCTGLDGYPTDNIVGRY